jgi:hypothetical protein
MERNRPRTLRFRGGKRGAWLWTEDSADRPPGVTTANSSLRIPSGIGPKLIFGEAKRIYPEK